MPPSLFSQLLIHDDDLINSTIGWVSFTVETRIGFNHFIFNWNNAYQTNTAWHLNMNSTVFTISVCCMRKLVLKDVTIHPDIYNHVFLENVK